MKSNVKRAQSNYALRMPLSLKKAAEQTARADGATLNQFIVTAVAEKLSALKTADYFAARAGRADDAAFDSIMARKGGQPPEPEDRIPDDLARRLPLR
jgi:hypothetical protein